MHRGHTSRTVVLRHQCIIVVRCLERSHRLEMVANEAQQRVKNHEHVPYYINRYFYLKSRIVVDRQLTVTMRTAYNSFFSCYCLKCMYND